MPIFLGPLLGDKNTDEQPKKAKGNKNQQASRKPIAAVPPRLIDSQKIDAKAINKRP